MPIEANCATHMGRAKRPISESTDKVGLAKGEDSAFNIRAPIKKRKIKMISKKYLKQMKTINWDGIDIQK